MKTTKILMLVIICFIVNIPCLQAQETLSASGGNATGSAGSVSYTFGQVLTATNSSALGSVAHGVQQPYEISVLTALNEDPDVDILCTVYPNPVKNTLFLKIVDNKSEEFIAILSDINGKVLQEMGPLKDETRINMSFYKNATYVLNILVLQKSISSSLSSSNLSNTTNCSMMGNSRLIRSYIIIKQ